METTDLAAGYRATLRQLDGQIMSSEAYLAGARGNDRRQEQRHLAKLRRDRAAVTQRLADLNPHVDRVSA